jgi:hypothetical protein
MISPCVALLLLFQLFHLEPIAGWRAGGLAGWRAGWRAGGQRLCRSARGDGAHRIEKSEVVCSQAGRTEDRMIPWKTRLHK